MDTKSEVILIVDDDIRMLRMMKQILEYEDFQVLTAQNGESAIKAVKESNPELVLLDIMMPGIDGLAVCERIREFSPVPIIMVTARSGNDEVVQGLDTGADDYVTKPFSASELAARVRAVLRRSRSRQKAPVFHLNGLTVNYEMRQVLLNGEEVKLTSKEYKILMYLTQNAGRIITPDQLFFNVWGDEYDGTPHLIQVNIGRLRKKLGDSSRNPHYIITRPGIGYVVPLPGQ